MSAKSMYSYSINNLAWLLLIVIEKQREIGNWSHLGNVDHELLWINRMIMSCHNTIIMAWHYHPTDFINPHYIPVTHNQHCLNFYAHIECIHVCMCREVYMWNIEGRIILQSTFLGSLLSLSKLTSHKFW